MDLQTHDDVIVSMPKGKRAYIQAHAEKKGEPLGEFLMRALIETMQRDNEIASLTESKQKPQYADDPMQHNL